MQITLMIKTKNAVEYFCPQLAADIKGLCKFRASYRLESSDIFFSLAFEINICINSIDSSFKIKPE
jgi:hypothetical protein